MTMKKPEAIELARHYVADIDNNNSSFANVSSSDPLWWLDIPVDKAMNGCYLLLCDGRNWLYIMHANAEFFRKNQNSLFQDDVKGVDKFRLHLSTIASNMFQDVRPRGGRVRFAHLLVERVRL